MKFKTYEELDEFVAKTNTGSFSSLDMESMVPELEKLQDNEIYLEIGVDKGKSLCVARTIAKPEVRVCGIDLRPDPKVPNTSFWQGDSKSIARMWSWDFGMWRISLLFIDGDHTYGGCRSDIDSWYPHMKEHGVIMFHDCDEGSPGVLWSVSEFVSTHQVAKFELFKKTDKNTSMAKIQL